jgi:hypothetical protein
MLGSLASPVGVPFDMVECFGQLLQGESADEEKESRFISCVIFKRGYDVA